MSEANVTPVRYLLRSPIDIEFERQSIAPDWNEAHYFQYARLEDELRFQKEQYKQLEEKYKNEKGEHRKQVQELRDSVHRYMNQMDYANEQRTKLENELAEFKYKADREKQELIRKLHYLEDRVNKQEQENAELERQVRDLQVPVQNEELQHKYDVCAANNEALTIQNNQFKTANDVLQQACEDFEKASEEFKAVAAHTLKEKEKIHRCVIQLMKENVDVRSVLEEHLKQENQYRKRLHEKQLNIEEILRSTQTADKHRNDPEIE